MGHLNYNTLRPISSELGQLPRLLQPQKDTNGQIRGKGIVGNNLSFQYQPSDHPTHWKDGGNLVDYTEDQLLYTVNQQGFRGSDIIQTDSTLMTAGCSHTYGIGVSDNEVWGSKLAEQLDMYHINIGCGGIGCDAVALLIKQFFEQGIVPDTLAVFWPDVNRKLIVSEKVKNVDAQITDFILENKESVEPYVFQFRAMKNLDTGHLPSNVLSAVKGQLLQSEQQLLLEFCVHRELVIALCGKHNVKLIEGFIEDTTLNFVREKCNQKIPRIQYKIWPDFARDNMHFGPRSHTQLAQLFKELL